MAVGFSRGEEGETERQARTEKQRVRERERNVREEMVLKGLTTQHAFWASGKRDKSAVLSA